MGKELNFRNAALFWSKLKLKTGMLFVIELNLQLNPASSNRHAQLFNNKSCVSKHYIKVYSVSKDNIGNV